MDLDQLDKGDLAILFGASWAMLDESRVEVPKSLAVTVYNWMGVARRIQEAKPVELIVTINKITQLIQTYDPNYTLEVLVMRLRAKTVRRPDRSTAHPPEAEATTSGSES